MSSRLLPTRKHYFQAQARPMAAIEIHWEASRAALWPCQNWEPEINVRPVQTKCVFFLSLPIEWSAFGAAKCKGLACDASLFQASGSQAVEPFAKDSWSDKGLEMHSKSSSRPNPIFRNSCDRRIPPGTLRSERTDIKCNLPYIYIVYIQYIYMCIL